MCVCINGQVIGYCAEQTCCYLWVFICCTSNNADENKTTAKKITNGLRNLVAEIGELFDEIN